MSGQLSILVITAHPDRRHSTEMLHLLVDHLARQPGTRVAVWFLRAGDDADSVDRWPGGRVVDDLRTWWPAQRVGDRLGQRFGASLRGIRLRGWLRAVRPDVVILDDGLGNRVLDAWERPVVRAVRVNPTPPSDAAFEPPSLTTGDLLIGVDAPIRAEGPASLALPALCDGRVPRRMVDHAARTARRRALGLPVGVPLVVGWGEDAWLDGTDLFVRALWALEDRQGIKAHGLWLGLSSDPHEADRMRAEAVRCGLSGRFHLRPITGDADRYVGDGVLLPSRVPGDIQPMMRALCSGLVVVTTDGDHLPPGTTGVPPLDVDTAAEALGEGLAGDRSTRSEDHRLLDADLWLEHHNWAGQFSRLVRR
jgi:hypothetical protein